MQDYISPQSGNAKLAAKPVAANIRPDLPRCLGSANIAADLGLIFLGISGAPGEIRTPDPQIRSLVLYPAELRALA